MDKKNKNTKINQLKKEIVKLERKINSISDVLKKKDEDLSDPIKFKNLSADKDFFKVYDDEIKKLKALENDWTLKSEELEKLI